VVVGLTCHSSKLADVEIGFFARWWDEQPDERRNATRALVENGQLEFENGAWCMVRVLLCVHAHALSCLMADCRKKLFTEPDCMSCISFSASVATAF
jgi:hypothetical protein